MYLYDLGALRWVAPPVSVSGDSYPPVEVSAAAGVIVVRGWYPPISGPTGGYDPNRPYLAVFDVPEWKP